VSAPVDVLAVMSRYSADFRPNEGFDGIDLYDARAAVAALIQAAENVKSWITDYVPDDACGREVELRELSAALARVQGGAA